MPPLNVSSFTRRTISSTATSMPFTIDVSTRPGASPYWSASTPMRELPRLPRRFEHAEPCRAGRVVDDVHALLVLVERELLALAGIAERIRRHAGVLHDHGAVRADVLHARAVARFEFLNERHVHAADEADLLRVADERRERADEERTFFFVELERRDVGRRQDGFAALSVEIE